MLNTYIQKLESIKKLPKSGGLYLHLGCGPHILDNWINIDKYYEDPRVIKEDIYNLDCKEVDGIYSSHSLEHLPIRHARLALKNWYKILKKGGVLYLAIPDLEETMRKILDSTITFTHRYFWYMHCLFGYQTDSSNTSPSLDSEIDLGQFHTCGFTEELIRFYLNEDGFKVRELFKYDGWSTPSIYLEAEK